MSTTFARCAFIRSAMLRPLSRGGEELGFDGGLLAGDAGGVGPVDPSAHPQGERVGLGLEPDGGAEGDGEGVGGAARGGEPLVPFAVERGQVAQVAGVVGAVAGADLGEGLEDRDDGEVLAAAVGEERGQRRDGCDVRAFVEEEQHGWVHSSAGGAGGGVAGDVGDVLDERGHQARCGGRAPVGRDGI